VSHTQLPSIVDTDALDVDSDESAYEAQVTAVEDALMTYGTDMVEGVSIPTSCFVALAHLRSSSVTSSS
jgi:hypothetical protein